VLELGCGDGGNALSMAQTLPDAQVLGVDASPGAIERGTTLARAAGLANVELRCATFEQLGDGAGKPAGKDPGDPYGKGQVQSLGKGPVESLRNDSAEFDYIVAHGVYSWVPPQARGALLDCVKRCLAPEGIAFVSYNAYPGSYLRDMARDMLRYHVQGVSDPGERLASAQELMRTIVEIEQPSPFARVLREQMERMLGYSDALLFHDDLAEVSTPFYFHEFVEHVSARGLQFLSEADLFESQMRDVPESAGHLMASLPEDAVVREQYMDFFKNRMFRQTLICHDRTPIDRALDEAAVEGLWISSRARPQEDVGREGEEGRARGETQPIAHGPEPEEDPEARTFLTPEGSSMTTSEPLVQAAMGALGDAWPRSLAFPTLLARAREAAGPEAPREPVAARLRGVLLQAYLARIVMLAGCVPPVSGEVGERPTVSPLARAQSAAGLLACSSLLHANIRLDGELEAGALRLLDGTRTLAEVAVELGAAPEQIAECVKRLASVGLLLAT
jgi:SAM-dependent methyltransferase